MAFSSAKEFFSLFDTYVEDIQQPAMKFLGLNAGFNVMFAKSAMHAPVFAEA